MVINKIALSPKFQSIIRKTADPIYYEKLNTRLPLVESSLATVYYSLSIHQNNKIDKDRKPAMHYQNIMCGAIGIAVSSKLNSLISKHKNGICAELSTRNINKVNNIVKGVQIALPLMVFSLLLRYIIPVISTPISTFIEKKRISNKTKTHNLNASNI